MSTEMKTGLVLSGGGAVGAYQAGVVKALAECGTQISMVSGASIGAFNGAIIAASPDLSEAAARLEALWKHLGNNQVLSVNRSVYFSLLKKMVQAMNLCQIFEIKNGVPTVGVIDTSGKPVVVAQDKLKI